MMLIYNNIQKLQIGNMMITAIINFCNRWKVIGGKIPISGRKWGGQKLTSVPTPGAVGQRK